MLIINDLQIVHAHERKNNCWFGGSLLMSTGGSLFVSAKELGWRQVMVLRMTLTFFRVFSEI